MPFYTHSHHVSEAIPFAASVYWRGRAILEAGGRRWKEHEMARVTRGCYGCHWRGFIFYFLGKGEVWTTELQAG